VGFQVLSAEEQSERSQLARIGGYAKWAKCEDPTAATAPARTAFLSRFEDEVDPDRTLPEAERSRRAEYARKAYFAKLALASAKARRGKKIVNVKDAGDDTRRPSRTARESSDGLEP
jgi:hypothetical protein